MTATKLVVWFSVVASVIVHGITVPVIKLGNAIPLSISRSVSRVTDNLPGLGSFVSRESSRRPNSVLTLPLPDPVLTDQRADVRVISVPPPVAQVNGDIERGKTLSWDENLERGRERMAMGL
ncbi:hypothetical protein TWF569_006210 [Orbilia oligospora]|nr:hypothetical protein TWF569_006210 [Orbilia oligospora]